MNIRARRAKHFGAEDTGRPNVNPRQGVTCLWQMTSKNVPLFVGGATNDLEMPESEVAPPKNKDKVWGRRTYKQATRAAG